MMINQVHHIKTEEGQRIKKSDLYPFLESNYKDDLDDLYEGSIEYIFSDDDKHFGDKKIREFSWHFFIKWEQSNNIVKEYLETL